MADPKPIAVTGMSWSTALGDDLESVWQALLAGETGFKPIPFEGRLRNNLAAPSKSSQLSQLAPSARMVQMACSVISRSLATAGRRAADPDVCLVLGTSLGSYLDDELARQSLSGWGMAVGRELGASSPPVLVSTACSAGSDAIMVGAELIRCGMARCCVCGGVDVLTSSKRLAHSTLGTMSPTQLRAFDVRHDGTLLGEGAAMIVLESEIAGRKPLAILRGTGSANDATGMTAADTTGLSAMYAMKRSLAEATLAPSAIGLINAHGSGTVMNDTTECNAFGGMFSEEKRPLVFATKGNFGHTLGATGAIEAIALVLSLRTGRVPPIAGLERPDPAFPLPLSHPGAVSCDSRVGLSLTLGFGGFDTSLIFEVDS